MIDIRRFEPIWENWVIDKEIGRGSFGTVWRAYRKDPYSQMVQYSAVKHISIPRDNSGDEDLLFSDTQSMKNYYDAKLTQLVREIGAMVQLRGKTNIVSYEEHKVVAKEGQIGYDLFLRMELLTSLTDYTKQHGPMDRNQVIKLGIDIANALDVLQKRKLIHRDVKPANIFVNDDGDFKLGDFGTARVLENQDYASTHTGTPNYMAPEVYSNYAQYDQTADIYSLGIVLYRYMNEGYLPLIDPAAINPEIALIKRIKGSPLPAPCQADESFARVILKACEFRPENRYQTAVELREALEALLRLPSQASINANDQTIDIFSSAVIRRRRGGNAYASGQIASPTPLKNDNRQDGTVLSTSSLHDDIPSPSGKLVNDIPGNRAQKEQSLSDGADISKTPRKKNKTAPIAVGALVAVAASALAISMFLNPRGIEEPQVTSTSNYTVTATEAPTPTTTSTPSPTPLPTHTPVPATAVPTQIPTATPISEKTPVALSTPLSQETPAPISLDFINTYAKLTRDSVNLRRTPSTSGTSLGRIPANTLLPILGAENDGTYTWYQVDYNGQNGYVRSDMTQLLTADELQAYLDEQTADASWIPIDFSSLTIGAKVELGRFEQDNDTSNGTEPIMWTVIYLESGSKPRALLLCDYVLTARAYDGSGSADWESSDLRTWLNDAFYQTAFSDDQRAIIAQSELSNGNQTSMDRVFVFSEAEADQYSAYLPTSDTSYAKANGASQGLWWLRTSAEDASAKAMMNTTNMKMARNAIQIYIGVRPAIWVTN